LLPLKMLGQDPPHFQNAWGSSRAFLYLQQAVLGTAVDRTGMMKLKDQLSTCPTMGYTIYPEMHIVSHCKWERTMNSTIGFENMFGTFTAYPIFRPTHEGLLSSKDTALEGIQQQR
jgi:hypothetical protein